MKTTNYATGSSQLNGMPSVYDLEFSLFMVQAALYVQPADPDKSLLDCMRAVRLATRRAALLRKMSCVYPCPEVSDQDPTPHMGIMGL